MQPILVLSSNSSVIASLHDTEFEVEVASCYEVAKRALLERCFSFVISEAHVPLWENDESQTVDALQLSHWLGHRYPWTKLIILKDGAKDDYCERAQAAKILPPPEKPEEFRSLLTFLSTLSSEQNSELPSPIEELLICRDEKTTVNVGCDDPELREDLVTFLSLKAENLSTHLQCGPLVELSWSGPNDVTLVKRGERTLLAVSGERSATDWSDELKAEILRDFGKRLS